MAHDIGAIGGYLQARSGRITLHLGSALLVGTTAAFDKRSFPYQEGSFANARLSARRAY